MFHIGASTHEFADVKTIAELQALLEKANDGLKKIEEENKSLLDKMNDLKNKASQDDVRSKNDFFYSLQQQAMDDILHPLDQAFVWRSLRSFDAH